MLTSTSPLASPPYLPTPLVEIDHSDLQKENISPATLLSPIATQTEKVEGQILPKNIVQLNSQEPSPPYFNEAQRDRFLQLDIENFLSKKYIAHLFGDSFLEETIHVGWFIGDALIHVIQVLKENQISPEVSQCLKDMDDCFNWQGRFMSVLYNLEDAELTIKAGEQIREELSSRIKELKIQDRVVFPGGYKGHSVLYEIKRTNEENYEFVIYNTGDGVEKHWMLFEKEGVHKIKGAYKIENISLKNLIESEVLEKLLLLKIEEPENFGEELYENILSELEGDREKMPTDIRQYMMSQRSGTCVWKMLCAYLRYNLPLSQYKYLKLKARLDVFDKWHELGNSLDFHKTNQKLLNRVIVNYERIIYKRDTIPTEFSRNELLVLGLLKVQKTFNRYHFLLSDEEISKTEEWYTHFTGQSIYENNGYLNHKESEKVDKHSLV